MYRSFITYITYPPFWSSLARTCPSVTRHGRRPRAAIAARNAAATAEAKTAKAQAAADKAAVEEVAGGALNLALTGGIVLLLGAAGTFASSIFGQANEVTAFNLDRNRLASDAERRAMGLDKK